MDDGSGRGAEFHHDAGDGDGSPGGGTARSGTRQLCVTAAAPAVTGR